MKLWKIIILIVAIPQLGFSEEQKQSSIGYSSVQEALNDLSTDPAVTITPHDGWTIATSEKGSQYIMWSFTPENHAAHPTAVKREVIEENGSVSILMNALCQSTKPECDKLIKEFEQLNENIRQSMQKGS